MLEFPVKKVLVLEKGFKEFEAIQKEISDSFSGAEIKRTFTARQAFDEVQINYYDLYIIGACGSKSNEIELIRSLSLREPDVPLIYLFEESTFDVGAEAIRVGASDAILRENLSRVGLEHAVWSAHERNFRERNRKLGYNRMRLFSEIGTEAIAVTDQNSIIYANEYFYKMFKCRSQDVIGFPVWSFIECSPEIKKDLIKIKYGEFYQAKGICTDGKKLRIEFKSEINVQTGKFRVVYIIRNLEENKSYESVFKNKEKYSESMIKNSTIYMAGVVTDLTEHKQTREQIMYASLHDFLTGLPNKELFLLRLTEHMSRAIKETKYKFSVLCVNLDRFNNINTSYGHQCGDTVLIEFARRMRTCLRSEDMLARLGADEFAIVLEGCDFKKAIRTVIKVLKTLFGAFRFKHNTFYLRACIGITDTDPSLRIPDEYLSRSHAAMYYAKKKGLGKYAVYNPSMVSKDTNRMGFAAELRSALNNGEFDLYYQPIIDLKTGQINAFEALVRWNHKEKGLRAPCEFIPMAEETGFILPLGEWVLEKACRQNKTWQMEGYRPMRVSVNFSVEQFKNCDVVNLISETLLKSGLSPKYLDVEITESVAMSSPEVIISILKEISHSGVKISIDDFGTGYSSLGRLKYYPNNTLKIDRTFIKGLEDSNKKDARIVQTIISLGKSLGMRLVAEGIETREQLNFIRQNGCDEAQGFLFSKPIPEKQFTKILSEGAFPSGIPVNQILNRAD